MDWIKKELEMMQTSPLFRKLMVTDKNTPETIINGEPKILAASNNYLGLASDSRVIEKAQEAIERFGTGSGGSRLTTGNLPIHVQLEQELAHFQQADSCLLYSSGYLANLGVISTLSDEKTVIFSDELNHASIIDACRLSKAKVIVYRHSDMNDLQIKLAEHHTHAKKIIVTDGVFSMDGDLAPLDQLCFLAEKHDTLLIIDDAHATGVIGKFGRGSADYYQERVDVTIGTLSKAIGSEGGFVCANKDIISFLIQKSRPFIFQTALAPASVAAALMSIDIIQTEPEHQAHLMDIGSMLRESLIAFGFNVSKGVTPIIPIIIGDAEEASHVQQSLHHNGVFIPAIRPPTVPHHTSRLRCTLMATHTVDHLNRIMDAFKKIT